MGVWLCFLPPSIFTGLFNITPNTAPHRRHRTARPTPPTPSCAHHVPDAERTTELCHHVPPSQQPHRLVTDFPSVWVRKWSRREMRQQTQVAQLSQHRDQGQPRLLTPKPVLSSGPPTLQHRFSTLAGQWDPQKDVDSVCGDWYPSRVTFKSLGVILPCSQGWEPAC